MGKLILFELKKLIHQRYLLFFIVLLLFVNVVNIYFNYDLLVTPKETMLTEDAVAETDVIKLQMDKDYMGNITAEKLEKLKNHSSIALEISEGKTQESINLYFPLAYTDMVYSKEIIDEMQRLYTYSDSIINPLLNKNSEIKIQAETHGDTYSIRTADLIEKTYGQRDISEYYRINEFEYLLTYHLSALFVLLLSVYCASNLFAGEKETQMLSLVKCSPNGKKNLFWAKLLSLAAFCVVVGAIFFITDLLAFWVCRRPSGFLLPIYAIESFAYSPLNINIVSFFMLISFLKIFGAFIVGVIAILFSVFFSKSYQAFVTGFLSVIALMGINLFTDGFFGIIRYFNPVTMFISVRLFETLRIENILNYPVYMYVLSLIGTLIFGGVFLLLSCHLYQRRRNNA